LLQGRDGAAVWGQEFLFAVESENPATVSIDHQPAIALTNIPGTKYWYKLMTLRLGTTHNYNYFVDGRSVGAYDVAGYNPDSYPLPGVARGKLSDKKTLASKIYPGMTANYWVYVNPGADLVRGAPPPESQSGVARLRRVFDRAPERDQAVPKYQTRHIQHRHAKTLACIIRIAVRGFADIPCEFWRYPRLGVRPFQDHGIRMYHWAQVSFRRHRAGAQQLDSDRPFGPLQQQQPTGQVNRKGLKSILRYLVASIVKLQTTRPRQSWFFPRRCLHAKVQQGWPAGGADCLGWEGARERSRQTRSSRLDHFV